MMGANQSSLAALCVLAPLSVCKNPNLSSLDIFGEGTVGWSDCNRAQKRDWLQPDNRRCALFAAEEGRERGNSTWAGEQGNIEGNLDLVFFCLQELTVEHLCGTRGSARHVFWPAPNTCPSRWEAPLVYVTPLCVCAFRWQGLDWWFPVAFG